MYLSDAYGCLGAWRNADPIILWEGHVGLVVHEYTDPSCVRKTLNVLVLLDVQLQRQT